MKLSPRAQRFVIEAIRDLKDEGGRYYLRGWMERSPGADLPPDIAELALRALESYEFWLRPKLKSDRLDEDQRADVVNDLAYIHTVQGDLRREIAKSSVRA